MSDCLFCRIAEGSIASTIVCSDDRMLAFRDANPQAPTHILLIPREHIAGVNDLTPGHAALIGHLVLTAQRIAKAHGLDRSGYRLVCNTGAGAGQSVDHLHIHLLAGRRLGWPPG